MNYRRERNKPDMLSLREEAQKLAFAPLIFQATKTMISTGVLQHIAEKEGAEADIATATGLSAYAVKVLTELSTLAGITEKDGELIRITRLGRILLEDETTKINFNFTNDVCYQGAFYLEEAIRSGKPEGLKVFGEWPTIYEGLMMLPEQVKKSWFGFDNYYSDIAFAEVISIILANKPSTVYDVGANSGKFGSLLLEMNPDVKLCCFDLPKQIELAKKNIGENERANFHAIDILKDELPHGADAVWMSQFLDCFKPAYIVSILQKAAAALNTDGRIYILEPFIDCQRSGASALSLAATSIYFTVMANGYSRMYSLSEFESYIKQAGLRLIQAHQGIGDYDYTLLECGL